MRGMGGEWQEAMARTFTSTRRGFVGQTGEMTFFERMRIRLLWLFMLGGIAIVFSRLIFLQVFEQGEHLLVSQSNHIEKVRDPALRGEILDKWGEALAKNVTEDGMAKRVYPLGLTGAHLVGYLSEVTEGELGCREGECYEPGMIIGRSGIEKMFENTLRGKDGGRLVEMDAKGMEVRELGANTSEQGEKVSLSIDYSLQEAMGLAIGSRVGSAVAIDLQGKVLGLYSGPSYDPNLFIDKSDPEGLARMLGDKEKMYFLNRAIAGTYAPGSVFKLVTAYAGLEEGVIDKETWIEDTGELLVNGYRYGNWYFDQYGRKEGEINVERALARSNDVFFYKVGELVGVDKLVEWAKKFGLGSVGGIELPGESAGLVPNRLWKERTTGERWFLGNTYHLSIGQGDLLATPLQIARMTAGAVSGRLCKVSILKDSQVVCEDLGLKTENIEIVTSGMKQVCQVGGTAFPFFDFVPPVMCKTGTAQHAGQKSESDLPHAWIVVVYPAENPEMVLTVMLDSAGEGSYEAGPVAREILERWLSAKR